MSEHFKYLRLGKLCRFYKINMNPLSESFTPEISIFSIVWEVCTFFSWSKKEMIPSSVKMFLLMFSIVSSKWFSIPIKNWMQSPFNSLELISKTLRLFSTYLSWIVRKIIYIPEFVIAFPLIFNYYRFESIIP